MKNGVNLQQNIHNFNLVHMFGCDDLQKKHEREGDRNRRKWKSSLFGLIIETWDPLFSQPLLICNETLKWALFSLLSIVWTNGTRKHFHFSSCMRNVETNREARLNELTCWNRCNESNCDSFCWHSKSSCCQWEHSKFGYQWVYGTGMETWVWMSSKEIVVAGENRMAALGWMQGMQRVVMEII